MAEHVNGDHDMLLKIIGIVFVVLVFLGLGVTGTFNAALAGYHLAASNPIIQQFQSKVTNTIKSEVSTKVHNIDDLALQVRSSKI